MQETKDDSAIKLFGRKITVPPTEVSADGLTDSGIDSTENQQLEAREEDDDGDGEEIDKEASVGKYVESMEEDDGVLPDREDSTTLLETSHESDCQRNPSMDEETAKPDAPETGKERREENTLKKPDKIIPCPRCSSMDTKFCYYNNYNVNQPRHFCKSCQRYWTAGGTMRNVPVGAGRRKNKTFPLPHHNYCHVTVPEALHAARADVPNGTHLPHLKSNGKVLSFGLEAPRYDYAVSTLHNLEGGKVHCSNGGNGDECSSGSSVTVLNSMEEGSWNGKKEQFQIQCIPWPSYPWNPSMPPGVAFPIYPAALPFWSYAIQGTWNPTCLGKHPREGDMLESNKGDDASEEAEKFPKQKNGSVLIPKTIRLDDPNEAAKSTIWTTLGIKHDSNTNNNGLLKKAFQFQPKGEDKNQGPEISLALLANPAALPRSLNFHETSSNVFN